MHEQLFLDEHDLFLREARVATTHLETSRKGIRENSKQLLLAREQRHIRQKRGGARPRRTCPVGRLPVKSLRDDDRAHGGIDLQNKLDPGKRKHDRSGR